MIKLDDANLVGVRLFCHVGGNRVPIGKAKYLWRPLLLLDDVGMKSSAVGYKVDLLFDSGGDNLAVDDEGGSQRS